MRLSWRTCYPVDRHHILWAGREGDHAIQFGAQQYKIPWLTHRRFKSQAAISLHWNVHKQVPGGRRLRRLEPQRGESRSEIIRTVIVVRRAAQQGVAIAVTGRYEGIVYPRRGILDERQDRAALIGDQTVTHAYHDPAQGRARVLHRHTLRECGAVKGPGVDDLLAVGVDDLDVLATPEHSGLALSCWNRDK